MLKSGDKELIQRTFSRLRAETKNILDEVVNLTWYMRGGIQYQDMMMITVNERGIIQEFIENRMESIKGHMNPVY